MRHLLKSAARAIVAVTLLVTCGACSHALPASQNEGELPLVTKIQSCSRGKVWRAVGKPQAVIRSEEDRAYILLYSEMRPNHDVDGFFSVDIEVDDFLKTNEWWRVTPGQRHMIIPKSLPGDGRSFSEATFSVEFIDKSAATTSPVFRVRCINQRAEQRP
jgi:hypothetical protein